MVGLGVGHIAWAQEGTKDEARSQTPEGPQDFLSSNIFSKMKS